MSLIPHICPNTPYKLTVTCVPQIIKCPIEYQGADFWDSARLAGHVCEVMYIGLFCHMNRALLPYEQGSFAVWIASLAMWIGSFAILYVKEYILYERTHSIWERIFFFCSSQGPCVRGNILWERTHSMWENTFFLGRLYSSHRSLLNYIWENTSHEENTFFIRENLFHQRTPCVGRLYLSHRDYRGFWTLNTH